MRKGSKNIQRKRTRKKPNHIKREFDKKLIEKKNSFNLKRIMKELIFF